MKAALVLVQAILLTLATSPTSAHQDYYDRHARDHARHRQFHYFAGRAHARAHDEGFGSRAEHRAYHRALRHMHRRFHSDHPGTWHDHYRWRRY